MDRLRLRQVSLELDLMIARRRAFDLVSLSPEWVAATAMVEDLERALWVLDRMVGRSAIAPSDRAIEPYRPPELTLATVG